VDASASETKAITRGELFTNVDLTGDVTGNLTGDVTGNLTGDVTGNLTGDVTGELDLSAIAETKADTAVDVFVYDTSRDSDGGAWRKRTQHTSWYNETLNTATRGSRREFPAVAVIVAESNKVTIYDGDDLSLPMWMVETPFVSPVSNFNFWRSGREVTSIFMTEGVLAFSVNSGNSSDGASGLCWISFASDRLGRYAEGVGGGGVATGVATFDRSSDLPTRNTEELVDRLVNDVAMTVLPDSPIDPATGLPVPTIACLVGETEVLMADGSTKRLDQVQPGEMVKTLEGEHKVLNWWDQGIKDVIELEFDGSQKLICTTDHKIRTTEGWIEAGDLTEDHEVIAA